MVDLPAPDSPVNHSTAGFCPFSSDRAALSTSRRCQTISALRVRIAESLQNVGFVERVDLRAPADFDAPAEAGVHPAGVKHGDT